ncbi:MAG: hypothetical protein RBS72_04540 [Sedimentisphaerales bacterium]|jgi:hypothetical protein|nr:hypothetical protein [Sedimentisphaerales bacterium]HNY77626.1 hypothetical protein [Sedimentisphaerales bacterium]HOC61959.1 hypothetical protein [Sedimentisphaerales bacterium]HOH63801.1 hypothetical protein [Sedimentisphaerales bacterium]HPY48295.1 hypothetical protein [Sedimentisphaerales bacterium]
MIWPKKSKPLTTLDRSDPLTRGLVCAARMDRPGSAASNFVYPHLLAGAAAPDGLATPIEAMHQDWYNRFGWGYSLCLWHDGITLAESWEALLVIGDSTMSWQRNRDYDHFRVWHNGVGHTIADFLLSDVTEPGFVVCMWAPPTLKAYVNGQLIATAACTLAPKTNSGTSTLSIGGSTTVRQLLVYDRALSADEVQRLYREPSAVFDRVGCWPPVVATGGTTHELTGLISAASSLSGTGRVTRRLSGQVSVVTSFASASLSIQACEPAAVTMAPTWRPWRKAVLCNGACPDAFKLGTVLTRGWFWVRRAGCMAVYHGPSVDQVDFGRIEYVADADARRISLPAHLTPQAGAKGCYVVRRFNGHGDEERTTGAAVAVRMDEEGEPAEPAPNDVPDLQAVQVSGGRVRLQWFYCPLDQQVEPARFNVYTADAGGQFDFDAPLATVAYRGRRFYHCLTGVLPQGVRHFVVRAQASNGIESDPGQVMSCPVRTGGPEGVTILAAEVIL